VSGGTAAPCPRRCATGPREPGDRLSFAIETGGSGGREVVAGRSDMPKARQDIGGPGGPPLLACGIGGCEGMCFP